jgi:molecular chaperone DnaK
MVDYSSIPRDSRRVPLETRVQFKFDRFSGFISEYSSNLSPTGMFIRTHSPEPPGRIFEFAFRLGDGFELINGRGEVVWNRAEDEGPERPAGMGIRFLNLGPGSKELIYKIVDNYVLAGGTPFDVSAGPAEPAVPAAAAAAPPRPLPPAAAPEAPVTPPAAGAAEPRPATGVPGPWLGPPVPGPLSPPEAEVEPASPPEFDAAVWLPPFGDSGLPGGDFQAPPAEPPAASGPMYAVASRSASARPRMPVLPLVILGSVLAVVLALFLMRDRLMSWAGLGDDEEMAQVVPVQRPLRLRHTHGAAAGAAGGLQAPAAGAAAAAPPAAGPALTSEPAAPVSPGATPAPTAPAAKPASAQTPPAATTREAAAGGPAPGAGAAQPLPEPVRRKPALELPPAGSPGSPAPAGTPGAALEGPTLTQLEKITWQQTAGGTELILWGNGAIRPESYARSHIDGNPPREVIRLRGLARPFPSSRLSVGTRELLQVRTGFHPGSSGNEVHVVLDLAAPGVTVARVEGGERQLRIQLARRPAGRP